MITKKIVYGLLMLHIKSDDFSKHMATITLDEAANYTTSLELDAMLKGSLESVRAVFAELATLYSKEA